MKRTTFNKIGSVNHNFYKEKATMTEVKIMKTFKCGDTKSG